MEDKGELNTNNCETKTSDIFTHDKVNIYEINF